MMCKGNCLPTFREVA